MKLRHELKTPTFALTTLGILGLCLSWCGIRAGQWIAFVSFFFAAAGIPMALGSEVKAKGEQWEWMGIYRSLRRPRPYFWWAFFSHLPQLLVSLWLAYTWFNKEDRDGNKGV
jgi:hypothetical protein